MSHPLPSPAPGGAPGRRAALLAGVLGAALWLGGCAALQPKTPEQVVQERAEARWAALIDGDFEKAWTYTQPGYRAIVKQKAYFRQFSGAGQWLGAQVHQATCEAERCTVRIRLTTKVLIPPFAGRDMVGAIDETWVREDGQWWYYQAL